MGRCCVSGCRSKYDSGPKVRVFGFPKDEARKKSWIRAIPRKYFTPSKHSKTKRGKLPAVCSSDFWTIKANVRCIMFLRIEDNPSPHEYGCGIANLSRGGLKFPQPCTVHIVLVMTLVEKLTKAEDAKLFVASDNQRGIVSSIATSLWGDVELETCENSYTSETLVRHELRVPDAVLLAEGGRHQRQQRRTASAERAERCSTARQQRAPESRAQGVVVGGA
ncbi:hypothetical protein HPB49_015842 [Dermacentor silvarum]|uniref:Uncharacterized protein n=1 Tax=Dermacentor silvarum TaxID=543639 RepID=A0ACB8D685_DERSI|nr:hypothetical protein HPB49_015842 [Dermacentor silvarum]